MQIDGQGRASGTRAAPRRSSCRTPPMAARVMQYTSNVQVGGKIAAVGQRLLESVGTLDDEAGARVAGPRTARAARGEAGRRVKPARIRLPRAVDARRGARAARRSTAGRQAARRRPEPHSGDELPPGDAGGARRSERRRRACRSSAPTADGLHVGGMTRHRTLERSPAVAAPRRRSSPRRCRSSRTRPSARAARSAAASRMPIRRPNCRR